MTPRERWQQLAPRERRLVAAAAGVVAVMLAYLLIWQPLFSSTARLREEVASQRELLQWLHTIEPEVQQLRGSRSMRGPAAGGSLLNLVDQTSSANGLKPFVTRIQPEGDKEVRVWLEQAPYDEVMRWLITLELDAGVRILEFSVTRGPAPGLVGARINLQRGA